MNWDRCMDKYKKCPITTKHKLLNLKITNMIFYSILINFSLILQRAESAKKKFKQNSLRATTFSDVLLKKFYL